VIRDDVEVHVGQSADRVVYTREDVETDVNGTDVFHVQRAPVDASGPVERAPVRRR